MSSTIGSELDSETPGVPWPSTGSAAVDAVSSEDIESSSSDTMFGVLVGMIGVSEFIAHGWQYCSSWMVS